MANPTFSSAFDEIGGKVSAYMVTEYNEGRLKDTNYATVQAQAINAIIQGSLTMSMQTDTQEAQTDAIRSDILIKESQSDKDLLLKDKDLLLKDKDLLLKDEDLLLKDKQIALTKNQGDTQIAQTEAINSDKTIKEAQSAKDLLLKDEQIILTRNQGNTQIAQTAIVNAQKLLVDKQVETNEADKQIKLYQLATLLPDEHNKNLKNQDLVSAQILQQGAEKLYTEARTTVVTESRIDNLILEDLKSQDTKLGTIGAGGLVPSTNDFNSANALRQVVYDRAKNPTGTLGDITFVAGTTYTKAV